MNWEREVELCPEIGALNYNNVAKFIAEKVFRSNADMAEILRRRYEQMVKNFGSVKYDDPLWNLQLNSGGVAQNVIDNKRDARVAIGVEKFKMDYEPQVWNLFLTMGNFGHDLPVWIKKRGSNPKRIVVIVSQDPERANDVEKFLYLSTPFGIHCCNFRQNKGKRVVGILERIISTGDAAAYLTDHNKFYLHGKNYVQKHLPDVFKTFSPILKEEISNVRKGLPIVAIMTLGKNAAVSLIPRLGKDWHIEENAIPYHQDTYTISEQENENVPTFSFVHPSNMYRSKCDGKDSFAKRLEKLGRNPREYFLKGVDDILQRN